MKPFASIIKKKKEKKIAVEFVRNVLKQERTRTECVNGETSIGSTAEKSRRLPLSTIYISIIAWKYIELIKFHYTKNINCIIR